MVAAELLLAPLVRLDTVDLSAVSSAVMRSGTARFAPTIANTGSAMLLRSGCGPEAAAALHCPAAGGAAGFENSSESLASRE